DAARRVDRQRLVGRGRARHEEPLRIRGEQGRHRFAHAASRRRARAARDPRQCIRTRRDERRAESRRRPALPGDLGPADPPRPRRRARGDGRALRLPRLRRFVLRHRPAVLRRRRVDGGGQVSGVVCRRRAKEADVKLGMNMLLWSTDVSGDEYDETFAMLKDAGYEGIEVPIFDAETEKYERLGERLRDLGLAPFGVTARNEPDSPISPDPEARRRGLEGTKAAVDACAAMGAPSVCGPIEAPVGVFSGKPPTPEERAWAVEGLRAAAEYADTKGVTLVVEYLNRFEMYLVNTAADLAELVREVDHPRCRAMYDTFHAHIEEKDLRAALQACKDVLAHVHA